MRDEEEASRHAIAVKLGRTIAAVEKMLHNVDRDLRNSEKDQ